MAKKLPSNDTFLLVGVAGKGLSNTLTADTAAGVNAGDKLVAGAAGVGVVNAGASGEDVLGIAITSRGAAPGTAQIAVT